MLDIKNSKNTGIIYQVPLIDLVKLKISFQISEKITKNNFWAFELITRMGENKMIFGIIHLVLNKKLDGSNIENRFVII